MITEGGPFHEPLFRERKTPLFRSYPGSGAPSWSNGAGVGGVEVDWREGGGAYVGCDGWTETWSTTVLTVLSRRGHQGKANYLWLQPATSETCFSVWANHSHVLQGDPSSDYIIRDVAKRRSNEVEAETVTAKADWRGSPTRVPKEERAPSYYHICITPTTSLHTKKGILVDATFHPRPMRQGE